MDSTSMEASMASTTSSTESPVSSASSCTSGSLPSDAWMRCLAIFTLIPFSLMVLDTFTGPSSLRKRLISPVIIGTA